jgi:hypothetical protein
LNQRTKIFRSRSFFSHDSAGYLGGTAKMKFVWLGVTSNPSLVNSPVSHSRVKMIFRKFPL